MKGEKKQRFSSGPQSGTGHLDVIRHLQPRPFYFKSVRQGSDWTSQLQEKLSTSWSHILETNRAEGKKHN